MARELEYIKISAEYICKAIESFDYQLAGQLRASFNKNRKGALQFKPQADVEVVYTEVEKL